MKVLVVDDCCAARAVLVAYVRQLDPTGYIFEAGNCSTALCVKKLGVLKKCWYGVEM